MKSAACVLALLFATVASTHAGLRAARGTARSGRQPAPGAASAEMFPEAIPGVLEAEARTSKSHLVVEDEETEVSALSLMAFLEVAAGAGKNVTMLNRGRATMVNKGRDDGNKTAKGDDGNKTAKEGEPAKNVTKDAKTAPAAKAGYTQKESFMMACLRHVEALIQRLDQSYTDIHLDAVLKDQCQHEANFPLSQSDGFKHKQACEEFADLLVQARDENLKDGTINGYTLFCNRMHEHKYGTEEPPKQAEVKQPEQTSQWLFWVITAIIIILVVCGIGGIVFYLTRSQA